MDELYIHDLGMPCSECVPLVGDTRNQVMRLRYCVARRAVLIVSSQDPHPASTLVGV